MINIRSPVTPLVFHEKLDWDFLTEVTVRGELWDERGETWVEWRRDFSGYRKKGEKGSRSVSLHETTHTQKPPLSHRTMQPWYSAGLVVSSPTLGQDHLLTNRGNNGRTDDRNDDLNRINVNEQRRDTRGLFTFC